MKHLPPVLSFVRNWSSYALAIKKASSSSSPTKPMHLYSKLHRKGVPLDTFCIIFTLKSCTHLYNLPIIHHLHAHIIKLGFTSHVHVATCLLNAYVLLSFFDACVLFDELPQKNIVTWNTMILGYSRFGDVNRARELFEEMPHRDSVSWSSMISAYTNVGSYIQSLSLFRRMLLVEGTKPDQVTAGAVLSGCAHMGCFGLFAGKSVHGYIVKNGWELNVEIGAALVNMYAKGGVLRNAATVFELMDERDVMSWTLMICGAARCGFNREALIVFEKMQMAGVKPNELTFTGVLNACAHGGFVEEGKRYFKMIEQCGLEPRVQHYACLVYLIGKSGMLEEAYEIIKKMKVEPNVVVLGSFLSACKEHKQFEIAERVIEQVLKTAKPENDRGLYSLIADLYVIGEKWEEAERLKELMVNERMKQARGLNFVRNGLR
ncbi:pentatricopeptide repeat-containing protein At2g20540-like [Cicer arietinum]|uniref:Pentatricopeptide repeat-containing protein At2g20540-like n=1 Tax=Cicer arietinum TaxID=3827 RepID=A0A1S2XVX4_CICAR|nr:pentatricopeptide repeat-containing protein At2g20540-like [Cicer arietinum]